jgi:ribosomal protein S18 acetylase RimI-like enzyme
MTVFLGIENGEAVSTATLIHSKDTPSEASVWSVAVHPDHQKRGHGYDIMHHLTQAAKDRNIHTLRLFASADGLHMYEKMGYKPVPGGTTHIFKLSSPQQ